jgi:hypothetical protein
VSFQVITTWKRSTDPDFEAKKNRILQLYGLMDGTDDVLDGDPEAVLVIDETGDLKKGLTTVGMRRQYGRDLMREVYLAADNCSTRREPPFEQSNGQPEGGSKNRLSPLCRQCEPISPATVRPGG